MKRDRKKSGRQNRKDEQEERFFRSRERRKENSDLRVWPENPAAHNLLLMDATLRNSFPPRFENHRGSSRERKLHGTKEKSFHALKSSKRNSSFTRDIIKIKNDKKINDCDFFFTIETFLTKLSLFATIR